MKPLAEIIFRNTWPEIIGGDVYHFPYSWKSMESGQAKIARNVAAFILTTMLPSSSMETLAKAMGAPDRQAFRYAVKKIEDNIRDGNTDLANRIPNILYRIFRDGASSSELDRSGPAAGSNVRRSEG